MDEDIALGGWSAIVDQIIRGDRPKRPLVVVGPTPGIMAGHGLNAGALMMSVDKIARCRREHPDVPLSVWYQLPKLLAEPRAIFPSSHGDRSVVVLVLAFDSNNDPIVVAITPDAGPLNVVMSIYGKENGLV